MSPQRLEAVREYKPFPSASYRGLDLNRLVVYVIAFLDEQLVPITFESVTVASFKLFPEKFQLVGFPEYPDAARVNRALLQLRPKYRNWAMGNVKRGFVLTELGHKVLDETRIALRDVQTEARPEIGRTRDLAADLASLEGSRLFAEFQATGRVPGARNSELYDALEAYPYTPRKALRDRLRRLEANALNVGRNDVAKFVRELHRTYAHVLMESD